MNLRKKPVMIQPHLPLIFTVAEYSHKGCRNLYDRLCISNNELPTNGMRCSQLNLLISINNNWTKTLNLDIVLVTLYDSL